MVEEEVLTTREGQTEAPSPFLTTHETCTAGQEVGLDMRNG